MSAHASQAFSMYTSAYDCTDIGTFTHLDSRNLLQSVHRTDPIIISYCTNTRSNRTDLLMNKTLRVFFFLDRHGFRGRPIARRRRRVRTFTVTMRRRAKRWTGHCSGQCGGLLVTALVSCSCWTSVRSSDEHRLLLNRTGCYCQL